MNNKFKKVISFLLVFLMALSLFAACGGKDASDDETVKDEATDNGKSDSPDTEEKQQEGEKEDEESAERTPEPADLGGYEYTIVTFWPAAYYPEEEGRSEGSDELLYRMRDLEDAWNFKIKTELLDGGTAVERITTAVMAGDKFADFMDLPGWCFERVRKAGVLADLKEVPGFDLNNPVWEQTYINMSTINGKTYGFSNVIPELRNVMFFNKTMLENENQPSPYELIESGEWTWEKFREICKATTKDTDGDGIVDQWGLGGSGMFDFGILFSNDARIVNKNADGKMEYGLNTPEAIEALNFGKQLVLKDKVVDPNISKGDWKAYMAQFMEGKSAFWAFDFYMSSTLNGEMEDDFGLILFPKGPNAKELSWAMSDARFLCMTASEKDWEKSVKITNEILIKPDDYEKEFYEKLRDDNFRDDESVEIYRKYNGKSIATYTLGIDIGPIHAAIIDSIRKEDVEPGSALDAIEEKAKQLISDYYSE